MRHSNKIPAFILLIFFWACQTTEKYDLLIQNVTIYDGSGNPPVVGSVAVNGDKIVKVGEFTGISEKTIDGAGHSISPGFIDMHSHLEAIKRLPDAENLVRQGVTTALGGPDGGGPVPFGEYLDTLEIIGVGPNVAFLVGHNTIRRKVMGNEDRDPTGEELAAMKSMVETAMLEGAFGISTGLKYLPGTFSKVEELIELSKMASAYGGIYTSHLREEGLKLLPAVHEAIEISREAVIPVVLTHHKAIGVPAWGKSVQSLAMVDSARNLGLDIMLDQYPYTASHTGIAVLIPPWALEGSAAEGFEKRVSDPVLRDSIKKAIIYNIMNDRGGRDLRRIQFSRVSWKEDLQGKTLHDWAVEERMEPTVENGAELVIRAQLNGGCGAIYHAMDDADVNRIMQHPQTMIGSDGGLAEIGKLHPHPRYYGTFPRVIGHYARDLALFPVETAIYKMTGLSADRLGIKDRGRIKEGNFADLVIFDVATIIDKSTFTEPHQYPEGIPFVIINGKIAVDNGEFYPVKSGKVLRGPGYLKEN